jgi:hypothetical protein
MVENTQNIKNNMFGGDNNRGKGVWVTQFWRRAWSET